MYKSLYARFLFQMIVYQDNPQVVDWLSTLNWHFDQKCVLKKNMYMYTFEVAQQT